MHSYAINWAERGWVPDSILRFGIRHLLKQRLQQVGADDTKKANANLEEFAAQLRHVPMVVASEDANIQHYEVATEFFQIVLGKHLKYSSGYWPEGVDSLNAAEEAMLELTVQRADVQDGQRILELGCGWGSLTVWMATHFPHSYITAISNSASQKVFIEKRCRERNLRNVRVLTANVSECDFHERFDRILSVEMFEHVRNHRQLLANIANWLSPAGKLFVHIFCHKDSAYLFEVDDEADWMARNFFRGGMMPAEGLLGHFDEHLAIEEQWRINGQHYARTCEAWLKNLDQHREAARQLFAGAPMPEIQLQRWRMFFMACAELFAFRQGTEWGVAHYLLTPVQAAVSMRSSVLG